MMDFRLIKKKKKFLVFGLSTISRSYVNLCKNEENRWRIIPRGRNMYLHIEGHKLSKEILLHKGIISAHEIHGFNEFIEMLEEDDNETDDTNNDPVNNISNVLNTKLKI
jgi:hypothetical protein